MGNVGDAKLTIDGKTHELSIERAIAGPSAEGSSPHRSCCIVELPAMTTS